MERLQAALTRARERRGLSTGGTRKVSGRRDAGGSAASAEVLARWEALEPYEPNIRALTANRIVSFFGLQEATPYDMMRTKVVQQARANGWRRIAVTSPTARCGKSTITANLAFSLARHTDLRTIVIETDLRRPALARLLGASQPQLFAKVLGGLDSPENHMLRYGANVAFATNAAPAANPAELLQSSTAKDTLAQIEAAFKPDLILFDTSPLLASDDTIGFLEHVDAAILVAAAEQSSIEEIDVSETEIAGVTQVLGVVLNKCQHASGGMGYDYNYDYA